MKPLKIGLFQFDQEWENKDLNKKKIIDAIAQISGFKCDLIIFPEMTLTGFSMCAKKLAEELYGDAFEYFSNMAKVLDTHIFYGAIMKEKGKYYNSLIHLDKKGKFKICYNKLHPFSFSREHTVYTKGTKPVIAEIGKIKIGLSICYDLRFPELFRKYAKEKIDMLVNIANWPTLRIEHWKTLIKARAIENQCFFAGVNRIGSDPKNNYSGYSSIISPFGETLFETIESGLKLIEIDLNETAEIRKKYPFLKDIRLI